uniref:Dymeclin n=1 Tax=Nicotiana tabacum TaxID=4097 RepID=A0A1S4D0T3_TOBAC|nr:PREDICTED: dymeclin-like [Nicotiana tabacum]
MGGVPSTPSFNGGAQPQDTAEYLIEAFIGEKSFPLASDYWQKLLELPLHLHWSSNRVQKACLLFAQNNCHTRHLAKILIHLSWCLQECVSTSDVSSSAYVKALNAVYISSVFLKHLIENAKTDNFEDLYMSLNESEEEIPSNVSKVQGIEHLVVHSVLNYLGRVDVSSDTYLLHHELLNFMLVALSTQLLSGPSLGADDIHPFFDAAMAQPTSLVNLVIRKLLLNYVAQLRFPLKASSYYIFSEGYQPGVLQRVGSVAANLVLLPLNFFASSSNEASKSPLADSSLNILLILVHYRKCLGVDRLKDKIDYSSPDSLPKEEPFFENPYCKALENARDIEFDRVDLEGNAPSGLVVRLPFASLFDTLGMCLADETSVLLLYSLVQGNSDFLEYVLVRTDLDTLLMPLLETLYNAPRRTSNQIYMVLIILLILSQDSSFNASIHKLVLPFVPWYQERDVYLHTNCLATLANMAPHVHRLSGYASQRLVSLFDMLARKYNKLAEIKNDKMHVPNGESKEGDSLQEDMAAELHIYTDFLRIVLEILNAILTYALPRNPEVVYAIMHRQEVFQPFKSHPRFNELLDNIFMVLDFFNSRMDAQKMDGEWSVEKVLQVIVVNCRSWRGDGIKMFTQLRFTYEQESHPEEFFIPYVWQLVLSRSGLSFSPSSINLFPVDAPLDVQDNVEEAEKPQKDEINGNGPEIEAPV